MTLGQFTAKYGTRTPELIVREAMRQPESETVQTTLTELLKDWQHVLEQHVYGAQ